MSGNRKNPGQRRAVRALYLAMRPELWEGLPRQGNPPYGCLHPEFMRWVEWKRRFNGPIVRAMKADGVLAPTTAAYDVNVPGLLEDARGIRARFTNHPPPAHD